MKFNADKCHVLHIGRSYKCGIHFHEMNQVFLSEVQFVKYLGILLSSDIIWSPTSPQLYIRFTNTWYSFSLTSGASLKYQEIAYQRIVRSQLENCATNWDPTLKGDITKLEQVQRKAPQWACSEYGIVSVTCLLRDLGWADLVGRWRNQRIILLFKILHKLLAVPPDSINIQQEARPAHDSKNQLNPQCSRASDKSFPLWYCSVFRTIPDWNNLPTNVADTDSTSVFKSQLAMLKPKQRSLPPLRDAPSVDLRSIYQDQDQQVYVCLRGGGDANLWLPTVYATLPSIGHCAVQYRADETCTLFNINLATSSCELIILANTRGIIEAAETFNHFIKVNKPTCLFYK